MSNEKTNATVCIVLGSRDVRTIKTIADMIERGEGRIWVRGDWQNCVRDLRKTEKRLQSILDQIPEEDRFKEQ
jgi:hypothetical protein